MGPVFADALRLSSRGVRKRPALMTRCRPWISKLHRNPPGSLSQFNPCGSADSQAEIVTLPYPETSSYRMFGSVSACGKGTSPFSLTLTNQGGSCHDDFNSAVLRSLICSSPLLLLTRSPRNLRRTVKSPRSAMAIGEPTSTKGLFHLTLPVRMSKQITRCNSRIDFNHARWFPLCDAFEI